MDNLTRAYSGLGDTEMLNGVQTMKDNFEDDNNDFLTFDNAFDAAYITGWQADIDAAFLEPSDEVVQDEIAEKTAIVYAAEKACRNHFQEFKYFALEGYATNKERLNTFGFDNYDEIVSTTDLYDFMVDLKTKATQYSNELTTAPINYPSAKITEIQTLATALFTANRAQEQAISQRPVDTQDRLTKMNTVWARAVRVSRASKIIYRNNPAKYHQYLLPGGSNTPQVETSISGVITNQATSALLTGVDVSLSPDNLVANSDGIGKYAFGIVPNGSKTIEISHTGFQPFSANVDYQGTPVVLDIELVPV